MTDPEPSSPNNPSAPRALLLLGQNAEQARQFHNQPDHWSHLAACLRVADLSARTISDDLSLLNPQDLARYDVILNYTTGLTATDQQVDALLNAVHGGTGYVGLHAATVTFTQHPRYLAMIGARFQRHDPIKRFTIHFTDHTHPISHGLSGHDARSLCHPTYRTLFTRAMAWAARRT